MGPGSVLAVGFALKKTPIHSKQPAHKDCQALGKSGRPHRGFTQEGWCHRYGDIIGLKRLFKC